MEDSAQKAHTERVYITRCSIPMKAIKEPEAVNCHIVFKMTIKCLKFRIRINVKTTIV